MPRLVEPMVLASLFIRLDVMGLVLCFKEIKPKTRKESRCKPEMVFGESWTQN